MKAWDVFNTAPKSSIVQCFIVWLPLPLRCSCISPFYLPLFLTEQIFLRPTQYALNARIFHCFLVGSPLNSFC